MAIIPFKLRVLKPSDKYSIAQYINNIKIWNQVRDYLPHPYSEKDAANYIDFVLESNPEWNQGIEVEGEIIGMIGITSKKDIYRLNGELGFWLAETYWGQGIMTMAIAEMTRRGFQKFRLHRIYSEVFNGNKASCRALTKNGYRLEATLKEAVIKNNQLLDLHIFARLASE